MSPFWPPENHAERRERLLARGRIKAAIRRRLESEGFTEVECGCLAASPGNEAHLHAFKTVWEEGGKLHPLYLHTSPEFAAKKLLAAGETRIFEFARVFRNRERGALHAPEFTMLEWYRANAPYEAVIADALEFLRIAADTTALKTFSYRDVSCDPYAEAERITVAQAFNRFADVDLLSTLDEKSQGGRDALAALSPVETAANDTWSDIFSKILVARIEPQLGRGRPAILYEYPACEAALARAAPHDPRVAERFELYVCGVELANGFGELTDAAEQRRRFVAEMDEKQRIYGERYPLDEDFLEALSCMPPAAGVALGFDRLAMLATGARNVNDVIWTPL
jgi:elongation factor P--(R)-beta-lysine ligase